jgi:predicted ATPase
MADEDERKVPITVITGFLGAGKTTLVNHILQGEFGVSVALGAGAGPRTNLSCQPAKENLCVPCRQPWQEDCCD